MDHLFSGFFLVLVLAKDNPLTGLCPFLPFLPFSRVQVQGQGRGGRGQGDGEGGNKGKMLKIIRGKLNQVGGGREGGSPVAQYHNGHLVNRVDFTTGHR